MPNLRYYNPRIRQTGNALDLGDSSYVEAVAIVNPSGTPLVASKRARAINRGNVFPVQSANIITDGYGRLLLHVPVFTWPGAGNTLLLNCYAVNVVGDANDLVWQVPIGGAGTLLVQYGPGLSDVIGAGANNFIDARINGGLYREIIVQLVRSGGAGVWDVAVDYELTQ